VRSALTIVAARIGTRENGLSLNRSVTTRFAPSPTGDLHLGGAWAALASWAFARAAGGSFVVRVEDIDTPRVVPGSEARILEDLEWLGLAADEPPIRQSERSGLYEEALAELGRQGRLYPCDCSRADIARVASAPHPGEEVIYPGTCRDKDPARPMKKDPALRFQVLPEDEVAFTDLVQGDVSSVVARDAGDFVLRRGDGVFAYQLAVAVDDLATRISHVIRGADLLASTARQLLLMKVLSSAGKLAFAPRDVALPAYAHVAMVVGPGGARLEKRSMGRSVRELRAKGVSPKTVLGKLAEGLGIKEGDAPITAGELATSLRGRSTGFRKVPWRIPDDLA
jgi:glutamyl-tRNA synthetase